MHRLRHAAHLVILAILVCAQATCQQGSKAVTMEEKIGPEQLTVKQIQSEVMSFADTMATRIAQATDQVRFASDDPSVRVAAAGERYGAALAAFTIASEPNPIAALLDMVVLATLSYEVADEYWIPEVYGELGQPVLDAYRTSRDEIWEIAGRVLQEEGKSELKRLIRQWREKHPDQVYVSHIRFSDFSFARGQMGSAAAQKGGNLLGLFMLDPMSKMTPATRQIEQSRLLGERVFYFSSRAPVLLGWQAEMLAYEVMATPEAREFLESTSRFAGASEGFVGVAEALPDRVGERVAVEREALVEQVSGAIAVEREALVEQLRGAIATEREALLRDLDGQAATLRPLVTELRETIDAGTVLSNSIKSIVTQVQATGPSDAPPLEMKDVRGSLVEATATAQEFNTLVQSLERLLSAQEPGRLAELQDALALAEAGGTRLVNRVFVLAVALVAIIFVASILKMVIRSRLAPPAGGSARAAASGPIPTPQAK